MKNFKKKLEEATKAAGVQEQELAKALGMTKAGFSIMKKNGTVRADALKTISDTLNLNISYFFEEGEETEIEFMAKTQEAQSSYYDENYVKLLERQVDEKDKQIEHLMQFINERKQA